MNGDPEPAREGGGSPWSSRFGTFLLFSLLALPFAVELGLTKGLNHDEHQHVAAGALIAREGLLPYRDFPHFHTPYLAYAYALCFRCSDHLLLAGRAVSMLSAAGVLGLVGSLACGVFRKRGRGWATAVGAGGVLLGLSTAHFSLTTGHAWNHEPSLFLALLAFAAHLAGLQGRGLRWFAGSGVLLALAIGTRITCAPLVAPFGLAMLLYPAPRWRWRAVGAFGGGMLLGLAPLLYLFAVAPEQALFGNLGFARVNITYLYDTGEPKTMSLYKKLRFVCKTVVGPEGALFVAALLPVLAACWTRRESGLRLRYELKFILLLLPFVLGGSLAPSPLYAQYFYPLVPWLTLAGIYGLASLREQSPALDRCWKIAAGAVLFSVATGARAYRDFPELLTPHRWQGLKLHHQGEELRSLLPAGRVLTLAPIYPLEGGLAIYPALSTGPFAWRISPYVEPAKAARLHLISPGTLKQALMPAPVGVLTGVEQRGEEALAAYARAQGYQRTLLSEAELWLPAAAR